MKRLFFILTIAASLSVSAQVKDKVLTTDSTDVQKIIDNVLASAQNKYSLISYEKTPRGNLDYVYESGDKKLHFLFERSVEGANYDLGKEGTVYYRLYRIYGYYQDLFPFWKQNFQPSADLEAVATAKHGEVQVSNLEKGKLVFAFAKEDSKTWAVIVNRY